MSEPDYQQIQEDAERYTHLCEILNRALQAQRAGIMTKEDVLTLQREFKLHGESFEHIPTYQ